MGLDVFGQGRDHDDVAALFTPGALMAQTTFTSRHKPGMGSDTISVIVSNLSERDYRGFDARTRSSPVDFPFTRALDDRQIDAVASSRFPRPM